MTLQHRSRFAAAADALPRELRGDRVPAAQGTVVHGYTHCSFMQIKPLECSLAIGELETATGVLVNKAGLGHSLTVAAVAVFPGRASIV